MNQANALSTPLPVSTSPATASLSEAITQTTAKALPKSAELADQDLEKSKDAGLFVLNDNDMDKLFSENLGVDEPTLPITAGKSSDTDKSVDLPKSSESPPISAQPIVPIEPWPTVVSDSKQNQSSSKGLAALPAAGKSPEAPIKPSSSPPQPVAELDANQASQHLFSIDTDTIDKIFADHLGVKEPEVGKVPKLNVTEAVKTITNIASMGPIPPPKIEGLGRLDSRTDSASEAGSGRIASIGKFLLDGKDLEKIGKITGSDPLDTKMRILTLEAAAELHALLQHVGAHTGVIGSVIVGHDGLLIANTMPPDMEAESFGIWAMGVYMNTRNAAKKLGSEQVHQIVSKTPRGYLIIADFGAGLLVTASDSKETETLIPLMQSISSLVSP
jgi:predicted regulator of Ras-like GTPase activity (Roadblock/LC7/MglB family)